MSSLRSLACLGLLLLAAAGPAAAGEGVPWRFVSIPDFLNVDTAYPEPKWEDALAYVLDCIEAEGPDFVLVAGDLVMGRWWDGPDQIEHLANLYYPAWKRRLADHGLTFYATIGDHEVGDNPWPPAKAKLLPHFKAAFRRHVDMPDNGPPGFRGTAWSLVHKGVLFVAVDLFEPDSKQGVRLGVTGAQLAWLDHTLAKHGPGANHIVVMGHAPILWPVRARASSRLHVPGGREAPLWQTMARHGVALYLCGEVHDITCSRADGVEQIAHGSLFGYVDSVNYLVATVMPQRLRIELKTLPIVCEGKRMWQVGRNRPHQTVRIPPQAKERGFRTAGTLVIETAGEESRVTERTGICAQPVPSDARR